MILILIKMIHRLLSSIKQRLGTSTDVIIYDRYDALGIDHPILDTVCYGQCEGTGWVPVRHTDVSEPWHTLWLEAEKKSPSDDGYHFVRCPECGGTGVRKQEARE